MFKLNLITSNLTSSSKARYAPEPLGTDWLGKAIRWFISAITPRTVKESSYAAMNSARWSE